MSIRHRVERSRSIVDDAEDGLAALFPPRVHVVIKASWSDGVPPDQVNAVMAEAANQFAEDVVNAATTTEPQHWSWETG